MISCLAASWNHQQCLCEGCAGMLFCILWDFHGKVAATCERWLWGAQPALGHCYLEIWVSSARLQAKLVSFSLPHAPARWLLYTPMSSLDLRIIVIALLFSDVLFPQQQCENTFSKVGAAVTNSDSQSGNLQQDALCFMWCCAFTLHTEKIKFFAELHPLCRFCEGLQVWIWRFLFFVAN